MGFGKGNTWWLCKRVFESKNNDPVYCWDFSDTSHETWF